MLGHIIFLKYFGVRFKFRLRGLTKKVVERLCEEGTTEAISLNDTNLCVIDCFSATATLQVGGDTNLRKFEMYLYFVLKNYWEYCSISLLSRKTEPWPKMDINRIRNIILETLCLVIIGEIISLLASKSFSWEVSLLTLAEVFILIILSFVAKKAPYNAILSTLVIFIAISIASAAIKPTYLGGSIIIKIFILIYLVRAISDARELQSYLKDKS